MEGFLECKDGVSLFYKKDIPKDPICNIVINHGFAEHCSRYDYVARKFNEQKIGVYRYDLRGHGRSKSEKGHIEDFMTFAEDANEMVNLVKKEYPELPLFMLGHSMGGFITCLYGIKYPHKLDGQIFSGAAVKTLHQVEGIKGNVLKAINAFLPKLKIKNKLSLEICSVKEVVEDYKNDPLILEKATLNFYVQFLVKGVNWVLENIEKYNYPCFITHGEKDVIVPKQASIDLYNNISSEEKEIKIYDNLYHEILNENEKDIILSDMIDWINNKINVSRD